VTKSSYILVNVNEMDIIQSIFLGLIQGIVEWLPISSEGQSMVFMTKLLNVSAQEAFSLAIFLHLGTMLAVILRFRTEFIQMLTPKSNPLLLKIIVISTLSTGVTAIPLHFFLEKTFNQGDALMLLIGVMLIFTGLVLKLPDSKNTAYKNTENMKTKDMVFLGLAQGFAILPGVSRSGTTMTFLLLNRMNQKHALEISFLISVPAVLGANVFRLLTSPPLIISSSNAFAMICVSFIAGYVTMDALLRFAARINFSKFCIVLGLITLIFALVPTLF